MNDTEVPRKVEPGAIKGSEEDALGVLPESRSRQARGFPSVSLPDTERAVFFVWRNATLTDEHRTALAILAANTTYLGHSSSLVSVSLCDDPPLDKLGLVPAADGVGLPRPSQIFPVQVSPHYGVPPARSFPSAPARPGKPQRWHIHVILCFSEPVAGPLAIGAGRYYLWGMIVANMRQPTPARSLLVQAVTTAMDFAVRCLTETRMAPSSKHFAEFYKALDASDLIPRGLRPDPFPWQVRLAALACAGNWPKVIALPTAAGKTAVMDIALFALAVGAPGAARRLFFVVDRRIVVDEAGERALRIANRLRMALKDADAPAILREVASTLASIGGEDEPLVVATLRGGTVRDDAWARSPAQPAICCAAVDQIGSRLLFRGYGLDERAWPIHAGLVGSDALVIVDEAHCAVSFVQTLSAIAERYHTWQKIRLPGGLRVVQMSATSTEAEKFEAESADFSDETLKVRFNRPKLARLISVGKPPGGKETDTEGDKPSAKSALERKREDALSDAFVQAAIEAARRLSKSTDGILPRSTAG